MDEDLLSIGRMAQMSFLTTATLRLYDSMGLLSPKYRSEETGFRASFEPEQAMSLQTSSRATGI